MLCRKCPGQGTRLSTNPSVIWPFARRRRAHEGCRLRCCRLLVAATLRDRAARPVLYDCQWPVPGLRRGVSHAACTSVVPPPPVLHLTRARRWGSCSAKMWGDASSAAADVGFYPHNLHWKIETDASSGCIQQLQPGCSAPLPAPPSLTLICRWQLQRHHLQPCQPHVSAGQRPRCSARSQRRLPLAAHAAAIRRCGCRRGQWLRCHCAAAQRRVYRVSFAPARAAANLFAFICR